MGLGWSGVDLFFVLSGFLITGILLDTRSSPRYFQTFYLRRVLRIFPLYFAYLFLILVAARWGWRWYSGVDVWRSTNPGWYFTYLLNWKWDHGYNDLFLGHLWSLAIEEQFYLVWPAVVWLVPRRKLQWLCLAVPLGSLGVRWYLGSHGYDSESIYRMTPCRMDCLALGALMALGLRDFRGPLELWLRRTRPVVVAAFVAAVALSPHPVWSDAPMRIAGALAIAALFANLVFHAATAPGGAIGRICSWRVLRACGKYSYAMYVLHSAPYHLTVEIARGWPAAAKYLYFPALAALAYGLAWVSWRILESPFLELKRRVPYFAPRPRTGETAGEAAGPLPGSAALTTGYSAG